ncbi:MAG: radical SAM family heme chaperone HemW [Gemmatimonadota bacterium]
MHLYLHIPFCARRCSYCDFAIAVRRNVPSVAFADAILEEWTLREGHEAWNVSPMVETIYFGGGTPSLLDAFELGRILERIRHDRNVAADAEITLEANPDDVTVERVTGWRRAGVNRISLGSQSFDPGVLLWMHRTHDAPGIGTAVSTLRAAGFENISLDLIFGLPASLGRDWSKDLDAALALEPAHLSLYGLTVEEHTPLAHWMDRRQVLPVADERYADEFLAAHHRLSSAGFEHYEVSNFGHPGRHSRHNCAYWSRAPYLGLGPSAHSRLGDRRWWNTREWAAYERMIARGDDPTEGSEVLTPEALRLEDLYLGLRTVAGTASDMIAPAQRALWEEAGWLQAGASAGGRAILTPEGWLRLDALVAEATPPINPPPEAPAHR